MRKLKVVFVIIFVVCVMLCNITYADNDFTQLSPILNNTSNIDNFNASNTSSTNNTNTNTTNNNLNYKVVGNEITITGVKQGITTVNIPSTIEEKTVTTIGENAFWGRNNITSITIPDTIQYIEGFAFYGCENITEIELPNNLKSIEGGAFCDCKSLKQIEIPCDLVHTGIFNGCKKLEKVAFSNGIKKINLTNFSNCNNLKEIHIPSSVTDIRSEIIDIQSLLELINSDNVTFYVEGGSYAQQYCQEHNIKYVATNGEGKQSQEQQQSQGQTQSQEKQPSQQKQTTEEQKQDPTTASTILPKAGLKYGIILTIILIAIGSGFFYKKHNYWKGVK